MSAEKTMLKQWEEKYHECLAFEFNNPKYFEVHHLLVLTYMLQTDGYSNECFSTAVDLLRRFLNESITHQAFIADFNIMKGKQRIRSNSVDDTFDKHQWNIDVLEVRIDNADVYCQDVRLWAKDVLNVIENSGLHIVNEANRLE